MIESININGSGGGGGDDEKAKVSANDTTAGFLNGKLVAGTGITFTENNNGADETLTIASSVTDTNDAAKVSSNDTTAGYLNGKLVAGTNITLTENNNGGNETLTIAATAPVTSVNTKTGAVTLTNTDVGAAATSHTHVAGDVTSGVFETARMANSGTASNATFLRGDRVWAAAPVTSVNNLTGAVTVETERIFSTTCLDAENTNSLVNIVSVTVPGGSGAIPNNQLLWIDFMYHVRNNSGSSNILQVGYNVGGTSYGSSGTNIPTGTDYYGRVRQYLYADGSNIRFLNHGQNAPETNYGGPNLQINTPAYWNQALWQVYNTGGVSFVYRFTAQWTTANASSFVRILNARAYLQPGQVT